MGEAPARWWHRVLPVSLATVVAVALAALLVPGVRTQLALSTTHRPEPYVELALARTATGLQGACGGGVAFDVTSHLADADELPYVVTVTGRRTVQRTGHVSVDPGETAGVTTALPRLPGRSTVTVRLPEQGQLLRVHCGPAGATGAAEAAGAAS